MPTVITRPITRRYIMKVSERAYFGRASAKVAVNEHLEQERRVRVPSEYYY